MATSATIVAIASAGHSGSTLLDVLLGSHSRVCSAGEMNRLTLYAADRVCACGVTVTSCPYWNGVRDLIARRRNRQSLIRWDECHTDVPPQRPILRLNGAAIAQFRDDQPVPEIVRLGMAEGGLRLSEHAILTRQGVRDLKWRVVDRATNQTYVLRPGEGDLEVYSSTVKWKNPVRIFPEPLELSLALGSRLALRALRACSASVARYVDVAHNSWCVADAMAEKDGAAFVIDSSKSPVRLKLLYMLRTDRVRILHLVRDGRAVAASAIRRHDITPSMAARIWRRDNQNLWVMLRTIPNQHKLAVRYEALCEDPKGELQKVCDFLGLEFENEMLTMWEREVHNIPGNPMLFDRKTRTIRTDERWRRDLTDEDIQAFERAAGRVNRSLGYV